MIEYYELKALDHIDDNYGGISPDIIEDAKYEEELENILKGELQIKSKGKQPNMNRRDRSDSIKKNIMKYEKMRRKNLNDSRENDFEGFDEDDFIGSQSNNGDEFI